MATHASIRGVVVVPSGMTKGAVVGDGNMGAIKGVITVVNREARRFPAWAGRMAHGTIRRDVQGHMVRVKAAVVIRCVTTGTGIGGVGVVPLVTGVAIVGNGYVRAREGIDRIMVKGRRGPGRFGMADGAIRRKLIDHVVGVAHTVVICLMAACASVRGVVVIALVASGTVVRDGRMRSVNCIIIVVNRECSRRPSWLGGMAHGTIRWNG